MSDEDINYATLKGHYNAALKERDALKQHNEDLEVALRAASTIIRYDVECSGCQKHLVVFASRIELVFEVARQDGWLMINDKLHVCAMCNGLVR